MRRLSSPSRLTALGCMVLTGGLLLPPQAFADSVSSRTPIQDAALRAVQRGTAAPVLKERRAQQPPEPRTDLRSKSFFKTPAGLATLVIFGAGVGYALYSSSNDRIRSEGR